MAASAFTAAYAGKWYDVSSKIHPEQVVGVLIGKRIEHENVDGGRLCGFGFGG